MERRALNKRVALPALPPRKGRGGWGKLTNPGWGGPAKGKGNGSAPHKLTAEDAKKGRPRFKLAKRVATTDELYRRLSHIALESDFEMASISASDKLLNRLEGAPIQRNFNLNADAADVRKLSDDELDEELQKINQRLKGDD